MTNIVQRVSGFTLIELMIAMALSAVFFSGIYFAFNSQQRTQIDQQLTADLQQNARAALYILQREIRMAGFDPTWHDADYDGVDDRRSSDGIDNDCDKKLDHDDPDHDEAKDLAGIVQAAANQIRIRLDREGDANFCKGDNLVTFGFPKKADRNRDGIADAGAAQLKRGYGRAALNQPVAENIQAIAFAYAFKAEQTGTVGVGQGRLDLAGDHIIWAYDSDGNGDLDTALDTNRDGVIDAKDDADGDGTLNDLALPKPAPINRIRAVRVWVLARTGTTLRSYSDRGRYIVGNKIIIPGDSNGNGTVDSRDEPDRYKRNLLVATVYCYNMGLR
jgi:type IV pilus assembly protein PilW